MCKTWLSVAVFLPAALAGETRQVVAKQYYRTFSHTNPVLMRIKAGDVVVTKTLDAAGKDFTGETRAERGNPLTGPFYIEGAEPGDGIAVFLRKVRLNR